MKALKRPWYEWIGWIIWLIATIVFLQTAIASKAEIAPTAALYSWIIFGFLIVFAAIVWIGRLRK